MKRNRRNCQAIGTFGIAIGELRFPEGVWGVILSFLPPREAVDFSRLCRAALRVVRSPMLCKMWTEKFSKDQLSLLPSGWLRPSWRMHAKLRPVRLSGPTLHLVSPMGCSLKARLKSMDFAPGRQQPTVDLSRTLIAARTYMDLNARRGLQADAHHNEVYVSYLTGCRKYIDVLVMKQNPCMLCVVPCNLLSPHEEVARMRATVPESMRITDPPDSVRVRYKPRGHGVLTPVFAARRSDSHMPEYTQTRRSDGSVLLEEVFLNFKTTEGMPFVHLRFEDVLKQGPKQNCERCVAFRRSKTDSPFESRQPYSFPKFKFPQQDDDWCQATWRCLR